MVLKGKEDADACDDVKLSSPKSHSQSRETLEFSRFNTTSNVANDEHEGNFGRNKNANILSGRTRRVDDSAAPGKWDH